MENCTQETKIYLKTWKNVKIIILWKKQTTEYYLNNYHYYAHTLKIHFSMKKDQKELKNLKQLTS